MGSTRRSIAKAVSYRILGTFITASVVFAATGALKAAATIGLLDTLNKIVAYVTHERTWNRIDYGREREPEYTI